jgi:uncharacterized protein (DUF58 family)
MTTALTRRGRVAALAGLVAVASALAAGGRALDAVVLPVAIALAAGYVQVSRVEVPTVRRETPADGFVGETGEMRLEFGPAAGEPRTRSLVADVRDRLGDGLDGPEEPVRAAVGTEPVAYRLAYRERGDQSVGPVDLTVTDVFGLFEREVTVDDTDAITVYPPRDPVPTRFRRELYAADAVAVSGRREEFDRLREYARGDAVRDVHWATTAKRDEIVVKEFAAETAQNRVSIAGGTTDAAGDRGAAAADALARATVSLALALLDDGVPVDLRLPNGRVSASPGGRGRREVLELAARTGPGAVADGEADLVIAAGADEVAVRTADRATDVATLRREARRERERTAGRADGEPAGRDGEGSGRPSAAGRDGDGPADRSEVTSP